LETIFSGWQLYYHQPVILASISNTLLYFNVLIPGAIIIAYLEDQSLPALEISIFIATTAIFYLSSTYTTPYFFQRYSIEKVGLVSIWLNLLLIASTLFYFFNPNLNMYFCFLLPVALSRATIYTFELSENQIIQTMIPENIRNKIFEVERAIAGLLYLCSFGLAVLIHEPSNLVILIIITSIVFFISCLSYTYWYWKKPLGYDDSGTTYKHSDFQNDHKDVEIKDS